MRKRTLVILAVVLLAAFVALTADVMHKGLLKRLDEPVGLWVHDHVPAWLMLPAAAGSGLGNVGACTPVVIAATALGLRYRKWRVVAIGLAALGLELVLIRTIKPWVGLERPDARFTNWVFDGGFTYPSGHTFGAMAVYGMVAMVLSAVWPRWRRLWWTGAMAVWVIVAASLVTVGVHFVTDVIASWLLGGAVMALAVAASKIAPRAATPRPVLTETK